MREEEEGSDGAVEVKNFLIEVPTPEVCRLCSVGSPTSGILRKLIFTPL